MTITKKKSFNKDDIVIKMNDTRLELVDEVKYLGVIIDNGLNFRMNCNNVIRKMAMKCNVLMRIGNRLNMQQKIQIYKSTIETHINYCATILFLANDNEIHRLQKIQDKCMRNILKVDYNYSSTSLLKTLEFLSIKQKIIFSTLVNIYKIVHKLTPNYLSCKLIPKGDNERKATLRNKNHIETNNAKKAYTQNSIFYKGIILYNKLPEECTKAINVNIFKSRLYKNMNLFN